MSYKPQHQEAIPALPEKYLELKKELAKGLNPDILSKAWKEVLEALEKMTSETAKAGPEVSEFNSLYRSMTLKYLSRSRTRESLKSTSATSKPSPPHRKIESNDAEA
jgi:hypothetical protein